MRRASVRRPEHVELLIATARDLLDDLEAGVLNHGTGERSQLTAAELVRQARRRTRDGYRTSVRPRAGGASSVLDDQDVPMPPVPDPVGELVVADADADPVRRCARQLAAWLISAIDDLAAARQAVLDAQPPLVVVHDDPGCVSHGRFTGKDRRPLWVPVEEGRTRCSWCHDWWLAHSADPAEPILRAHDAGRRITTKLVKELLRDERRASRRRAG